MKYVLRAVEAGTGYTFEEEVSSPDIPDMPGYVDVTIEERWSDIDEMYESCSHIQQEFSNICERIGLKEEFLGHLSLDSLKEFAVKYLEALDNAECLDAVFTAYEINPSRLR